jgi:hypothetical protein
LDLDFEVQLGSDFELDLDFEVLALIGLWVWTWTSKSISNRTSDIDQLDFEAKKTNRACGLDLDFEVQLGSGFEPWAQKSGFGKVRGPGIGLWVWTWTSCDSLVPCGASM